MFRSKKTKLKSAVGIVKDWRDAGAEIDRLGTQIDHAREVASTVKTKWARDFWNTTANRLHTKWQLMIKLRDSGLKQRGPNSFYSTIDYYWFEKSDEIKLIGFTWFDYAFDNAGLQSRLDESWNRSKELKLEKARQGLA